MLTKRNWIFARSEDEERGTSVLVFLINSAALTHSSGELELFGTKKETDTQFHSVHILRYESSTLILYKELSSPIFQSLSVSE